MKRFSVLIICILLAVSACTVPSAYAAPSSYARASVRDAYFFTEKNASSSLFAVPYTYCIEVIRDDGEWYYARYAADAGIYKAVYGYCRKQDFTPESGIPAVTYLYKPVSVNFSVSGDSSSLPALSQIAIDAAYYGVYYAGATVYSYVYCQGSFGYIEGANDDYPLNAPAENGGTQPDEGGDGDSAPEWSVALTAFIIITVLFVAVISILCLTARKPRAE